LSNNLRKLDERKKERLWKRYDFGSCKYGSNPLSGFQTGKTQKIKVLA